MDESYRGSCLKCNAIKCTVLGPAPRPIVQAIFVWRECYAQQREDAGLHSVIESKIFE